MKKAPSSAKGRLPLAGALLMALAAASPLFGQRGHYAPNAISPLQAPPLSDICAIDGFPPFSIWMYGPDFRPAHWLGLIYEGETLREPINVVIKDSFSKTPEEAMAVLMAACREAGFPESPGHSTGYFGYIAGRFYGQLPVGKGMAFSDGPPEFDNNHGRIFGPYRDLNAYWFVGAFSREGIHPISKVPHHYVSFDHARDSFTQRMENRSGYEISGFLSLGNYALNGSPGGYSTGDHDGVAVFLNLQDPLKPRVRKREEALPLPSSLPAAPSSTP